MLVRTADADDVPDLAGLRARWHDRAVSATHLDEFREWFGREQATRWWWIAADGDVSVGMVNMKLFDRMPSLARPRSRWGYLANLYVVPERRGAGIGGSLLTAALVRARAERLARVVLSPSELSVPLYHRHGFRAAAELLVLPLDPA